MELALSTRGNAYRCKSGDEILAFENLPSWDASPTEVKAKEMLDQYANSHLGYWHPTGHGGIRENLRVINQRHWFDVLPPHQAGMHLHDVGLQLVVEPCPGTPVAELRGDHRVLRQQLLGDATGDEA